jgi:hypothetical protein
MKNMRFLALIVCLIFMVAACDKKTTTPGSEVRLQSWIDAPLDGMQLPLAPYLIVFHVTDSNAVTSGELTINGSVVADIPNPDGDTNYAALTYNWQPIDYGIYTIAIRAKGVAGDWGDFSQVVVEILKPKVTFKPMDIKTPTYTPTATFTLTPTVTSTLTPTPTLTATRRPGPDKIKFLNPHPNTSQIYFRGSGCGRKEVDFYVTIPTSANASQVTVYYRLMDRNDSNHSTSWFSKLMYHPTGSTEEWLQSVNPETEISGTATFPQANIQYYFTALNALSSTAVTSDKYENIRLDICNH